MLGLVWQHARPPHTPEAGRLRNEARLPVSGFAWLSAVYGPLFADHLTYWQWEGAKSLRSCGWGWRWRSGEAFHGGLLQHHLCRHWTGSWRGKWEHGSGSALQRACHCPSSCLKLHPQCWDTGGGVGGRPRVCSVDNRAVDGEYLIATTRPQHIVAMQTCAWP